MKTIRLSETHEFPESVVQTWVYYSVLRLLGFSAIQTSLTLIGITGEDGRYICLQLFANGNLFEIVAGKWNLAKGEFELAWNDFGRLLSSDAFDGQLLAASWKEIFEDSHISDAAAELKSAGIVVPEPDGLNPPIVPGKTVSDALSVAAIEKSRPVAVRESIVDQAAGGGAGGETNDKTEKLAASAAEMIVESVIQSMVDEIVKIAEERSAADDPTGTKKRARDLSLN